MWNDVTNLKLTSPNTKTTFFQCKFVIHFPSMSSLLDIMLSCCWSAHPLTTNPLNGIPKGRKIFSKSSFPDDILKIPLGDTRFTPLHFFFFSLIVEWNPVLKKFLLPFLRQRQSYSRKFIYPGVTLSCWRVFDSDHAACVNCPLLGAVCINSSLWQPPTWHEEGTHEWMKVAGLCKIKQHAVSAWFSYPSVNSDPPAACGVAFSGHARYRSRCGLAESQVRVVVVTSGCPNRQQGWAGLCETYQTRYINQFRPRSLWFLLFQNPPHSFCTAVFFTCRPGADPGLWSEGTKPDNQKSWLTFQHLLPPPQRKDFLSATLVLALYLTRVSPAMHGTGTLVSREGGQKILRPKMRGLFSPLIAPNLPQNTSWCRLHGFETQVLASGSLPTKARLLPASATLNWRENPSDVTVAVTWQVHETPNVKRFKIQIGLQRKFVQTKLYLCNPSLKK